MALSLIRRGVPGLLGGGDWTPLSLGAAARWYDPTITYLYQDAAQTTPVTALNDPVGGWDDRSENGDDGSQSATKRPTWKPDGFGSGLPALLFTLASQQTVRIDSLAPLLTGANKPYTVIASVKYTDPAARFPTIFGVGDSIENTYSFHSTTQTSALWRVARRGPDITNGVASSGGAADTNTHVVSFVFGGGTNKATLRVNGVAVIDNADLDNGTPDFDQVDIGGLPNFTGGDFYMTGLIGDVIFYPGIMSDADIALSEEFVAPRCGLDYPFV